MRPRIGHAMLAHTRHDVHVLSGGGLKQRGGPRYRNRKWRALHGRDLLWKSVSHPLTHLLSAVDVYTVSLRFQYYCMNCEVLPEIAAPALLHLWPAPPAIMVCARPERTRVWWGVLTGSPLETEAGGARRAVDFVKGEEPPGAAHTFVTCASFHGFFTAHDRLSAHAVAPLMAAHFWDGFELSYCDPDGRRVSLLARFKQLAPRRMSAAPPVFRALPFGAPLDMARLKRRLWEGATDEEIAAFPELDDTATAGQARFAALLLQDRRSTADVSTVSR
jgi:hypothetical protein